MNMTKKCEIPWSYHGIHTKNTEATANNMVSTVNSMVSTVKTMEATIKKHEFTVKPWKNMVRNVESTDKIMDFTVNHGKCFPEDSRQCARSYLSACMPLPKAITKLLV